MFKNIDVKKIKNNFLLTPTRVAILGLLLALTISMKYLLGFVPGLEVISFLFIMYGVFLPFMDLALLVFSFNMLIIVIYGFGGWWFAYWIIWPMDAFISKFISLKVKNRFVFGVWGFIAGASVGFWYFWSDWFFFGLTFARLNIITAIPINTIEGITTMISIIILGPYVAKVFNHYSMKIWKKEKAFEFSEVKNVRLNVIASSFLCLLSIAGIVTLYVKNDFFFSWKSQASEKYYKTGLVPVHTQTTLTFDPQDITSMDGARTTKSVFGNSFGGSGHKVLFGSDYNEIYDTMHKTLPGPQAAIVIIANNKFYTDIINLPANVKTAEQLMLSSKRFEFKTYDPGIGMGRWIETFRFKKPQSSWLHGTAQTKNYGDFYPLYYVNHKFANLGITSQTVKEDYILEITYDHNA